MVQTLGERENRGVPSIINKKPVLKRPPAPTVGTQHMGVWGKNKGPRSNTCGKSGSAPPKRDRPVGGHCFLRSPKGEVVPSKQQGKGWRATRGKHLDRQRLDQKQGGQERNEGTVGPSG